NGEREPGRQRQTDRIDDEKMAATETADGGECRVGKADRASHHDALGKGGHLHVAPRVREAKEPAADGTRSARPRARNDRMVRCGSRSAKRSRNVPLRVRLTAPPTSAGPLSRMFLAGLRPGPVNDPPCERRKRPPAARTSSPRRPQS